MGQTHCDLAMKRWKPDGWRWAMTAIAFDPAGGGNDNDMARSSAAWCAILRMTERSVGELKP